jgi:hypothetical protein
MKTLITGGLRQCKGATARPQGILQQRARPIETSPPAVSFRTRHPRARGGATAGRGTPRSGQPLTPLLPSTAGRQPSREPESRSAPGLLGSFGDGLKPPREGRLGFSEDPPRRPCPALNLVGWARSWGPGRVRLGSFGDARPGVAGFVRGETRRAGGVNGSAHKFRKTGIGFVRGRPRGRPGGLKTRPESLGCHWVRSAPGAGLGSFRASQVASFAARARNWVRSARQDWVRSAPAARFVRGIRPRASAVVGFGRPLWAPPPHSETIGAAARAVLRFETPGRHKSRRLGLDPAYRSRPNPHFHGIGRAFRGS